MININEFVDAMAGWMHGTMDGVWWIWIMMMGPKWGGSQDWVGLIWC